MGIRARVADMHKALLSVAEVVDKGFRVVFGTDQDGRDISYMARKSDGQRLEFRRRNKVYEIDWDILPYQPEPEDETSFPTAIGALAPRGGGQHRTSEGSGQHRAESRGLHRTEGRGQSRAPDSSGQSRAESSGQHRSEGSGQHRAENRGQRRSEGSGQHRAESSGPLRVEDETAEQEASLQEGPAVRPKRAPHMPTQAEVAAHEITHEPCRDWRRACVAGQGLADKHVQSDHCEVALPTVASDYGYPGDREEECSPILCGKGRDSRWYYNGILMPCKGTQDAYCAKQTTTELSLAGHRRFVLRSDGESAILALRVLVCAKLAAEHGQETVVETSSKGDSQGNGLAEQAAREVKAKTRTLKFHTEEPYREGQHGPPVVGQARSGYGQQRPQGA